MADGTATMTQSEYDTKVEDVSTAKKRLTITVPSEVIDEKIAASMGTLAGQTVLPGFRKGRSIRDRAYAKRSALAGSGEPESRIGYSAVHTEIGESGERALVGADVGILCTFPRLSPLGLLSTSRMLRYDDRVAPQA